MNGDIEETGASALMSSHMSGRMISQFAVVGGRRRWLMDQKLDILCEAFGPDGSVGATCQRHATGSGLVYTWRRQALAGDLTGTKRARQDERSGGKECGRQRRAQRTPHTQKEEHH